MANISRQERPSWYVPGKTVAEVQHLDEHEALQILQRLALNNRWADYEHLLMARNPINGETLESCARMWWWIKCV